MNLVSLSRLRVKISSVKEAHDLLKKLSDWQGNEDLSTLVARIQGVLLDEQHHFLIEVKTIIYRELLYLVLSTTFGKGLNA